MLGRDLGRRASDQARNRAADPAPAPGRLDDPDRLRTSARRRSMSFHSTRAVADDPAIAPRRRGGPVADRSARDGGSSSRSPRGCCGRLAVRHAARRPGRAQSDGRSASRSVHAGSDVRSTSRRGATASRSGSGAPVVPAVIASPPARTSRSCASSPTCRSPSTCAAPRPGRGRRPGARGGRASRSSFRQALVRAPPSRRAVGERGRDRAARLAVVLAVAEPAALPRARRCRRTSARAPVGVPQRELAHPGRVEDEAAVGQEVELAAGRRVPAAGVVLADLADERPDPRRRGVLRSVDLPTPDEPTNATVRPAPIRARTSSTPRPSNALTDDDRRPGGDAARPRAGSPSTSPPRSAFERTTTGSAPLSQATAT